MNREELKQKLDDLKIPDSFYSLYGELRSDTIIIYHNYSKWEVFYLGERGDRNELGIFSSEDEACDFVYDRLYKAKAQAIKDGHNWYGKW